MNKGEEPPEAFTKGRLGYLASRLPILVLNDEGHHCWRPKVEAELKGLSKEEKVTIEEELEEAVKLPTRTLATSVNALNFPGAVNSTSLDNAGWRAYY